MDVVHKSIDRVTYRVGGPARRSVIMLLACILALDAADKGAVTAVAFQLEQGLHIGNAGIGLMITVSSLVTAIISVPMGHLVDHSHRVRLIWISMLVWCAAEALSSIAPSYLFLIATRVLLGAATATAGPAIASLTGDFFPPRARGRIWGFILTGEALGTGIGLLYSGLFGDTLGWRAAFASLCLPSLAGAFMIWKFLPEPARGGASWLAAGANEIIPADQASDVGRKPDTEIVRDTFITSIVEERGIGPAKEIVLDAGDAEMNLWQTIVYVLRVKTNLVLIIGSSLGYFFLSGARTFSIIYLLGRFQVNQGIASLVAIGVGAGIVVGLLVAGRVGDAQLKRGKLEIRILIGVVGYIVAAILLGPALSSSSLYLSAPLLICAGFALAAPNPGLDAARLDVVPSRMWGRSEAIRTLFRQSLEAFAPLVFGVVSSAFGSPGVGFGAGVNASRAHPTVAQTTGLEYTFLLMLVLLIAGGLVLLAARRSYPVDIASAVESDRRMSLHTENTTASDDSHP
ncbi:MAG: MFS transporter [Acidimicrobiales bacterium]